MPAVKVQATKEGWYGGQYRNKGDVFFVVDEKDALTGEILHYAEEQKDGKGNITHRGAIADKGPGRWMVRVKPPVVENAAVVIAREAEEAQKKADLRALAFAGIDPNSPEAAALATGAQLASKATRGMTVEGKSDSAAENGKDVL